MRSRYAQVLLLTGVAGALGAGGLALGAAIHPRMTLADVPTLTLLSVSLLLVLLGFGAEMRSRRGR